MDEDGNPNDESETDDCPSFEVAIQILKKYDC